MQVSFEHGAVVIDQPLRAAASIMENSPELTG